MPTFLNPPFSTGISCTAPPSVANAVLSLSGDGRYPTGKATYTCTAGFQLQNSNARELACGVDGSYQGTLPQCVGVVCPLLALGNGTVSYTNSRRYPSTATLTCNSGYALGGSRTLNCGADGEWDGSLSVCYTESVSCGGGGVCGRTGLEDGWENEISSVVQGS